ATTIVKVICSAPAPTLDPVHRRKHEACHMTVVLPNPAPSIAVALKVREEFEGEFLARRPTVEQVIKRAKQQRAAFIAALWWRFAPRRKALFSAAAHLAPLTNRRSQGMSTAAP